MASGKCLGSVLGPKLHDRGPFRARKKVAAWRHFFRKNSFFGFFPKKCRQAATFFRARNGPLSCRLGPKTGPEYFPLANTSRPVCTPSCPDPRPDPRWLAIDILRQLAHGPARAVPRGHLALAQRARPLVMWLGLKAVARRAVNGAACIGQREVFGLGFGAQTA